LQLKAVAFGCLTLAVFFFCHPEWSNAKERTLSR
jgi:hypothetical protein